MELVAKGISVLFPSCHIQKGAHSCRKICFCYQKCRFPASLSSFLHLRGGGSCPQGRVCEAAQAQRGSVCVDPGDGASLCQSREAVRPSSSVPALVCPQRIQSQQELGCDAGHGAACFVAPGFLQLKLSLALPGLHHQLE